MSIITKINSFCFRNMHLSILNTIPMFFVFQFHVLIHWIFRSIGFLTVFNSTFEISHYLRLFFPFSFLFFHHHDVSFCLNAPSLFQCLDLIIKFLIDFILIFFSLSKINITQQKRYCLLGFFGVIHCFWLEK